MRTYLFLLSVLCFGSPVFCQVATHPVSLAQLPGAIHYKGKFTAALQFADARGSFLLLTTQTGIEAKKAEGNRSAHLYAYTYNLPANSAAPVLLWQMSDGVEDCPLDIIASFVEATTAVTDLDKNGTAEVWLMYRTACRGDVSGADTKIIMHEGSRKYAMRGEGKIQLSGNVQPGGGTYTFDDTFQKGAAVFRGYAEGLWKEHVTETMQ